MRTRVNYWNNAEKWPCSIPLVVRFRFNQFESRHNCTCANHQIIVFGSGQKSLGMYILHNLIYSLNILPVLSQKYAMSPFNDIWESYNSTSPPSPNRYYIYLDPVPPAIVKDDLSITYFRFQARRSILLGWRGDSNNSNNNSNNNVTQWSNIMRLTNHTKTLIFTLQ